LNDFLLLYPSTALTIQLVNIASECGEFGLC
jgi:hypothetical protein